MEQDTDWVVISGLVDPHLLFKLIRKVVLKQSDDQCKLLVVDVAKQECLAQPFINNSIARMQSSDVKEGTLQGVQRDNGDVLASFKMKCAHFEIVFRLTIRGVAIKDLISLSQVNKMFHIFKELFSRNICILHFILDILFFKS
jgi:hypothetical protein